MQLIIRSNKSSLLDFFLTTIIISFFLIIPLASSSVSLDPSSAIHKGLHGHFDDNFKFTNIEDVKKFLNKHNIYPTTRNEEKPTLEELQLLAYEYIKNKQSEVHATVTSEFGKATSIANEKASNIQEKSTNFWQDLKDTVLYYVPTSFGNNIDVGFKKWYFEGWDDAKMKSYLAKHKLKHLVKKGMTRDEVLKIIENNWDSILKKKRNYFKTNSDYFNWLVNDFGWDTSEMQKWLSKQGVKEKLNGKQDELQKAVVRKYEETYDKQEEISDWFNNLSKEDLVSWLNHQYAKMNDYSGMSIEEMRKLAVDTFNDKKKDGLLDGEYFFYDWSFTDLKNWLAAKGENVGEEYEELRARAKERFDDMYRNARYKFEDSKIEKKEESMFKKWIEKCGNWLRFVNPLYYWF